MLGPFLLLFEDTCVIAGRGCRGATFLLWLLTDDLLGDGLCDVHLFEEGASYEVGLLKERC